MRIIWHCQGMDFLIWKKGLSAHSHSTHKRANHSVGAFVNYGRGDDSTQLCTLRVRSLMICRSSFASPNAKGMSA